MAATTISRATWTDGVSGTLINNARLQADVYDRIDSLLAAAITFGSTVTAEGFGTHVFSAAGTGANTVRVRNTSAGATNTAVLEVGNDAATGAGALTALASTFTPTGAHVANGVTLAGTLAGGLSLAATNASGAIRLYAGGTTERVRVTSAGRVGINDTAPDNLLHVTSGADAVLIKVESTVASGGQISYVNTTRSWQAGLSGAASGNFIIFDTSAAATRLEINSSGQILIGPGAVGTPALSSPSDTNTGIYFSGADEVLVSTGGSQRLSVGTTTAVTGTLTVSGSLSVTGGAANAQGFLPNSDDLYDLGGPSDRFDDVYATNATIQTSDRNLKKDIAPLPLGLTFLRALQPVQYRWNRDGRKGTGRLHCGLIAQDVLSAAPTITQYGVVTGEGTEAHRYGLRYTELIAPLIAAVQELAARLEAVEAR